MTTTPSTLRSLSAAPTLTHPGGSLTDQQRRDYDDLGYVLLDRLLDDNDLAPARLAMTQKVDMIAQELLRDRLITDALSDASFEKRLALLFKDLTAADFLKYGRSWRDRIPGYFILMSNPKILNAVESLIGPEIFSNPVYNVRPKVPGIAAGAVPWHQDKSYWPDANSNPVITAWIPLVDSTTENGCLHLIPGTHRHKLERHGKETLTGTAYTETDPAVVADASRKRQIVALPMRAGSVVLFNDRLLHMSTPNQSDHVRWSVDLRYQPTDQDPMPQHGAGFLARSAKFPHRVAQLEDWLANRPEHLA